MLEVKENGDAKLISKVKTGKNPQPITGWVFHFRVFDDNGVAFITKDSSDPTQIVVNDVNNGIVWTYIKAADTVNRPGRFHYEMQGVTPTGEKYPLDQDVFVISPTFIKT